MNVQVIPTDTENPDVEYPVNIGGRELIFRIRYNERSLSYFMDVKDSRGVLLTGGLRILANGALLYPTEWQAIVPDGFQVWTVSIADSTLPPAFGELGEGQRVELVVLSGF